MRIENYVHRGGRHVETTALANALAHAGVLDPTTRAPLSEAAVLGVSGGIGAGLSFCPSVLRHGMGAGITVVSRHRSVATDGGWHRDALDRLGVPYEVEESSTPRAAQSKLVSRLEAGQPVIVQCSRSLPHHGPNPTAGVMEWAWDVIVVGVDLDDGSGSGAGGSAEVGDLEDHTHQVPLAALAAARNQTCTHKNRAFAVQEPRRALTKSGLAGAMRAGLTAGVAALHNPRIKTFSLAGLAQWAGSLGNLKAKSGWRRTFAGGALYWALRDVFRSIETTDGGGLMRPMFAEFLDEAAAVLRKKALTACAEDYRALAVQWTALADAALPARVPAFKKIARLRRAQAELTRRNDARARAQLSKNRAQLAELELAAVDAFPLGDADTDALLADLSARVAALHEAETAALARLAAAIG